MTRADALYLTLERTLRRLRRTRRAERACVAIGALSMLALAIAGLDAWLRLPVWGRAAALGAVVVALVGAPVLLRLDRKTRRAGAERAAALLERAAGLEDAQIIAGSQLRMARSEASLSASMASRAEARAGALAIEAIARRPIRRDRLARRGAVALASVLALATIGIVEHGFLLAPAARMLDPGARLPAWSPVKVTLDLPDPAPLVGDDVTIEARGADAERMTLELLESDRVGAELIDRIAMRRDDDGVWRTTLRDLRASLILVAGNSRAESAPLRIEPVAQPRIDEATLTVRRDGEADRVERIDPAAAPEVIAVGVGDEVTLRVVASMELSGAGEGASIEGRTAQRTITPAAPGEVTLALRPVGPTGLAVDEQAAVSLLAIEQVDAGGGGVADTGAATGADTPGGEASSDPVAVSEEAQSDEGGGLGEAVADAPAGAGGERGVGGEGPNIAIRRDDPLPERIEPAAPVATETLIAIETRAGATGTLAPGVGIRRVPEAYRDRVGAYFLRLLREEAPMETEDR